MKHKVRGKLTGMPLNCRPLFDTHNWESIMETLREAFGNPQAHNKFNTRKASASIRLLCQQAGTQSHDRALALAVYNQLGDRYREGYFSYFNLHYPLNHREERLDVLKEYLDSIKKTLPMGTFSTLDIKESQHKSNNLQINTISSSNEQSTANRLQNQNANSGAPAQKFNSKRYKILDITKAIHQGYYLEKLEAYPTKCLSCQSNGHYTIECYNFKSMNREERQNFVDSNQLCSSCIITTDHKAHNCQLKRYCGVQIGDQRCEGKHHASLHTKINSQIRSSFTLAAMQENPTLEAASASASKANYSGYPISDTKGNNAPIFANIKEDGFTIFTMSESTTSVNKQSTTLKLFRTFVSNNNLCAATYAVGDSAAEISLVKRSLVDALGITGTPFAINVHWTDGSTKLLTGIKVNLPIKGILPNSKEFILEDFYAIEDLNLPSRSLNVEKLKRNNPHLRSIPFDNYNKPNYLTRRQTCIIV
ncbi:hypothetical protein PVAND_009042 [Polypedilum vanderplanki]|uniref:Peptidase aspartic putative domain-containing protein n=1 Tax=Polypedilum vanderplanki TaxID=319348 RepID=A0A9J6CC27_POLVA|nr:hypothetical protein PVAND_009042 [Polypedilum vanderplanki]